MKHSADLSFYFGQMPVPFRREVGAAFMHENLKQLRVLAKTQKPASGPHGPDFVIPIHPISMLWRYWM
jgi:hypothetical protein